MSKRSRDIDGQVFGKLTVVRFDHVENKRQYYLCRCECGKEKVVLKSNLTTSRTTSCGCNRRKNPPKKVVKSVVEEIVEEASMFDWDDKIMADAFNEREEPIIEVKDPYPTNEALEYHLNKDTFILTDENYYSLEANTRYCSASQLKQFIGSPNKPGCEARAMAEIRGEWKQETTKALLQGSILDALWENDDPDYIMSRFPECISSRGATKGQLKSEYQDAIAWYQLTLKSKKFCEYMGGEKQVIMTGNIEGLPFKIKIDSYHPDRAIVDLKTTKTLDRDYRIFIPDSGERLPFYEAYGYPLQLAIYREVVRQNTGYVLPCYLACVDKHTHPICDIIQISDGRLDDALEEVKRNCEKVIALKSGEIEPIRCEHSDCDYCRDTHECQLISDEEFEAHDIENGAV